MATSCRTFGWWHRLLSPIRRTVKAQDLPSIESARKAAIRAEQALSDTVEVAEVTVRSEIESIKWIEPLLELMVAGSNQSPISNRAITSHCSNSVISHCTSSTTNPSSSRTDNPNSSSTDNPNSSSINNHGNNRGNSLTDRTRTKDETSIKVETRILLLATINQNLRIIGFLLTQTSKLIMRVTRNPRLFTGNSP